MVVPLIVPPVMVTLSADKLFAVNAPDMVVLSRDEPILIVSATVLSVAILTRFPPVPVAILIVLALLPLPRFTAAVVPESRVRALAPVVLIVPAPANVSEVAVIDIVSIELTPVRAPAVVTLSPDEESWNVPVEFPIDTLFVPVPSETAPKPLTVNAPDPWE
jgi:hypothetical protein